MDDITWKRIKECGIILDENLSVEQSPLGGSGIFYTSDDLIQDHVIARIPAHTTFDLNQLMTIQEKLKQISPDAAFVVKQVLSNCGGINETEIIIDYFFSFMIILTNENRPEKCPLIEIEYYLEVLSRTHVDTLAVEEDLESDQMNDYEYDYLIDLERKKRRYLNRKYQHMCETVNELGFTIPSFEEYYHINRVIKSRVLEIPQAIDPTETTQNGPDKTDFVVNTTLVPLLDFANHDENNNAFFDVDRKTNDILLKYLHQAPGKHEVFIKYSDIVSVQLFVSTYGFIPKAKEEIFELKIGEADIHDFINEIKGTKGVKYELIMKWLEMLPTVQFINTPKKLGINYNVNPIPFWLIFAKDYQYLGWKDKVREDLITDSDICDNPTPQVVASLIKFQEDRCDVIQGIEKVAIEPDSITEPLEPEAKQAVKLFLRFLKKVAKRRDMIKENDLTAQYLRYKYKLFEKILEQDDFDVKYNPDWDEAYRYPPITVYNS